MNFFRFFLGQPDSQLLSKKLVFTAALSALFPFSAKILLLFGGKKRFNLLLAMSRLLAQHHTLALLRRQSREDVVPPSVTCGIALRGGMPMGMMVGVMMVLPPSSGVG
ncbi:MAG: hypothetical protein IJG25_07805, partial [Thermoguttaceae bacterium]|nr:hypothetical protein [Thermoguttaceae bacterium]